MPKTAEKSSNMKRYCPQTSKISFEVLVTLIRLTNPALKQDWVSICLQALLGVKFLSVKLHKYIYTQAICVSENSISVHFLTSKRQLMVGFVCSIVSLGGFKFYTRVLRFALLSAPITATGLLICHSTVNKKDKQ